MAGVCYNEVKRALLAGEVDLDAHTIKIALVTGYTPNIDTHDSYTTTISSVELVGTGYTAGGKTLTSPVVSEDTVNDRGKFDAVDVTWTGIDAGTPSHAVLYDDTHATKVLIAYWPVTTPTNGGDYTLQFHADGILLLS